LFVAEYALLVANRDSVCIPLIAQVIPSQKQFRAAISSISPAQQAFATLIRSQQLSDSALGVMVLNLKPAIEMLLNVAEGTMTKEIALSERVMQLFVEYDIPPDLLRTQSGSLLELRYNVERVNEHLIVLVPMASKSPVYVTMAPMLHYNVWPALIEEESKTSKQSTFRRILTRKKKAKISLFLDGAEGVGKTTFLKVRSTILSYSCSLQSLTM
jgi:hypothetical protein